MHTYLYINLFIYVYIYIYIYTCVTLCVCVCSSFYSQRLRRRVRPTIFVSQHFQIKTNIVYVHKDIVCIQMIYVQPKPSIIYCMLTLY